MNDSKRFKTHNPDGTAKTCKFCHGEVWWDVIDSRWYDVGGETLHVESCELRKRHFHEQAMQTAEAKRQRKS